VLLAETLLPAPVLLRLERAYLDALAELARERRALLPGDQAAQPGLALLRQLAARPDTRHPRGNPYARLVAELPAAAGLGLGLDLGADDEAAARLLRAMRPVLVTAFAYGVPTDAVLDRIVSGAAGLVLELGAGGGYWARCLRDRGAAILAFDRVLPIEQVRPGGRLCQHHPVAVGGPVEALAAAPEADTLLLCWPPGLVNREEADAGAEPIFSTMGMAALDRFVGPRLVFVGDRVRSFGSPAFFERLDREWVIKARLPLPNLGTWTDAATFLERA
jgi:hypothetical protein